jgi:chromate transporter
VPGVPAATDEPATSTVSPATIAREWTRIGLTGFGGPPVHVALLRELVVVRRQWIDSTAFEDANAACGLLPGPASTQLGILLAYRLAGPMGAIVGGLGFILPAVILVLLSSVFVLAHAPPSWLRGAGAGAGAAVAAVAVRAGWGLVGPSRARAARARAARARPAWATRQRWGELRWAMYLLAGTAAAALAGAYVVFVLLACGLAELVIQRSPRTPAGQGANALGALFAHTAGPGGVGALAWTALKVGALSFGGGFVIVPLMQGDAVHVYHWMTNTQFLDAVALGQITPGPVTATVAAVGYAAGGIGGGVLASVVAFAPSFCFVFAGARRFERLRASPGPRSFLDGAGPAAIGAIFGAAITLAGALAEGWQFAVLAAAAVLLLPLRRGVVQTLLGAAALGAVLVLLGAPVP